MVRVLARERARGRFRGSHEFPFVVSKRREQDPQSWGGTTHGNSTRIEGGLDSIPGTYAVELFVSGQCDPAGFGEGATPFTSFDVTVSQTSHAFSVVLHDQLPPGGVVTGTATDGSGNTSEFSACAVVDAPGNSAAKPDASAQQPTSTDSEPASEDEEGGQKRPSGR